MTATFSAMPLMTDLNRVERFYSGGKLLGRYEDSPAFGVKKLVLTGAFPHFCPRRLYGPFGFGRSRGFRGSRNYYCLSV
jgi:hypothetical protein